MLDDLVAAGKIRYYGVSVEKVEEALKAIEFPNVQTVQIIFNCFRQRPADAFFAKAQEKRVGILARVPLASGLLTGKLRADSRSPRTTTATSIGAEKLSTWERHFPEWITTSASTQWRRFGNSCLPGSR